MKFPTHCILQGGPHSGRTFSQRAPVQLEVRFRADGEPSVDGAVPAAVYRLYEIINQRWMPIAIYEYKTMLMSMPSLLKELEDD